MKPLYVLLLCLFCCPAASAQAISADSSSRSSAGVLRKGTYFYRQPGDPKNVVRAGLDNMPIRRPDADGLDVMPNMHAPNLPEGLKMKMPEPDRRKKNP